MAKPEPMQLPKKPTPPTPAERQLPLKLYSLKGALPLGIYFSLANGRHAIIGTPKLDHLRYETDSQRHRIIQALAHTTPEQGVRIVDMMERIGYADATRNAMYTLVNSGAVKIYHLP